MHVRRSQTVVFKSDQQHKISDELNLTDSFSNESIFSIAYMYLLIFFAEQTIYRQIDC